MKTFQKACCPNCGYQLKYKDMFSWGVWWDLSCPSCNVQLKYDFRWELKKVGVILLALGTVVFLNLLGLPMYILGPLYILFGIVSMPYFTRLRIKNIK